RVPPRPLPHITQWIFARLLLLPQTFHQCLRNGQQLTLGFAALPTDQRWLALTACPVALNTPPRRRYQAAAARQQVPAPTAQSSSPYRARRRKAYRPQYRAYPY